MPNAEKLICPQCRRELPDDSKFCQYCVGNIPAVEPVQQVPQVVAEKPKAEPVQQTVLPQTPPPEEESPLGLVPNNPIYTNGEDQQKHYLQCLHSIDGEVLRWNYRGAMSVDGIRGSVDIYDAYLPSGAEYKTVYLHTGGIARPVYAPKGFSYVSYVSAPVSPPVSQPSPRISASPRWSKYTVRKWAIAGGVAVCLLLGIWIGVRESRYQEAHRQLDLKNYQAAYAAFEELGSYRDSEKMLETVLDVQYKDLREAMQQVSASNYKTIGEQIDRLPLDYRDMDQISTEYGQMVNDIRVLAATKPASSLNELLGKDNNALRSAYANLITFDNKNNNWNLNAYLMSVRQEYLFDLVFGVEWEADNGRTFFSLYEAENGEVWLRTNLPSDKVAGKDYYYYVTSPDRIGYANMTNSKDKFTAYRLTDISYVNGVWQLKIYCYLNSRTRTMTPANT